MTFLRKIIFLSAAFPLISAIGNDEVTTTTAMCQLPQIDNADSTLKVPGEMLPRRLGSGSSAAAAANNRFPVVSGSLIYSTCKAGFKFPGSLADPLRSVCQSDGTWTLDIPSCKEIKATVGCGAYPKVKNGRLLEFYDTDDVVGVPSFGRIECNDGYELFGSSTISCDRETEKWSRIAGLCIMLISSSANGDATNAESPSTVITTKRASTVMKTRSTTTTSVTTTTTTTSSVPVVTGNSNRIIRPNAAKPASLFEVGNSNDKTTTIRMIAESISGGNLRRPQSGTIPERVIAAAESGDLSRLRAFVKSLPRRNMLNESYWLGSSGMANNNLIGDSPLHVAARWDNADVAAMLVATLPEMVLLTNRDHLMPIHVAALAGGVKVLAVLATHPGSLELRDSYLNRTALFMAAEEGKTDAVRYLVDEGANLAATSSENDNEQQPIHVAAKNGHFPVVKLLLEQRPELIEAKQRDGATVVHLAAAGGGVDLLAYLLSNYPKMTDVSDLTGSLPAHYAASAGNLECLKYLTSISPKQASAINNAGRTPLHEAASNGRRLVVLHLMTIGSLVDAREFETGRTALHLAAASNSDPSIVKLLVSGVPGVKRTSNNWQVADVYAKTSPRDGERLAIHFAAENGHLETVKFFIANYPQLMDAGDSNGLTALYFAEISGSRNQNQAAMQVAHWLKSNS